MLLLGEGVPAVTTDLTCMLDLMSQITISLSLLSMSDEDGGNFRVFSRGSQNLIRI